MAKPRISILDPKFKYRNAADTDVARHLRAHKLAQRKAERRQRREEASSVVRQLTKRSGT